MWNMRVYVTIEVCREASGYNHVCFLKYEQKQDRRICHILQLGNVQVT